MGYVPLKIPRFSITVARFSQCDGTGFPRAQVFGEPFDRPILARRIPSFEYHTDLHIVLDHVALKFDQFNLQTVEFFFIGFSIHHIIPRIIRWK